MTTRWSYKVARNAITFTSNEDLDVKLIAWLNSLGQAGWELIDIQSRCDDVNSVSYMVLLKKPV